MNSETSRYIFRIALIKEIMENNEKYGFKIDRKKLWKEKEIKTIKVSKGITNLSEWAEEN